MTYFCILENIPLVNPVNREVIVEIERGTLGTAVVLTDLFIMLCFIMALWFIIYFVRKETERHKKLLFESKDFAIELWRLPKLTNTYNVDVLKADLWHHITDVISREKQ